MVTLDGLRNSPASCVHLILKLDGMKGGSFPVFMQTTGGNASGKKNLWRGRKGALSYNITYNLYF